MTLLQSIKAYMTGSESGQSKLDPASLSGVLVKGKTTLDDMFTGEIYSIDKSTQTISVVKSMTVKQRQRSFLILPFDSLAQLEIVEKEGHKFVPKTVFIESADMQSIQTNEMRTIERYRKEIIEEKASQHPDITPLGRKIFRALAKTYPVTWNESSITVADEVSIELPYRPSEVRLIQRESGKAKSSTRSSALCERLKKVVQTLQES